MNHYIVRDSFQRTTIFLIEEKLIKSELIYFLKNQQSSDPSNIRKEENLLEELNQKIAKFGALSTSIQIKRASININPFFLTPEDLQWAPHIGELTTEDLNYVWKINQYCMAHNRILCGCGLCPQEKR